MKKYSITIASYSMMSVRPVGLVEFFHNADSSSQAYEYGVAQGKLIFPNGCFVEAREFFTQSWLKRVFGIGR